MTSKLVIRGVRVFIPTTHNSDDPLLRQPITPTAHSSENHYIQHMVPYIYEGYRQPHLAGRYAGL